MYSTHIFTGGFNLNCGNRAQQAHFPATETILEDLLTYCIQQKHGFKMLQATTGYVDGTSH